VEAYVNRTCKIIRRTHSKVRSPGSCKPLFSYHRSIDGSGALWCSETLSSNGDVFDLIAECLINRRLHGKNRAQDASVALECLVAAYRAPEIWSHCTP